MLLRVTGDTPTMTSPILVTETNDSCWLVENPLLFATLCILRLLPAVNFEVLNVCSKKMHCVQTQVDIIHGFTLYSFSALCCTVLYTSTCDDGGHGSKATFAVQKLIQEMITNLGWLDIFFLVYTDAFSLLLLESPRPGWLRIYVHIAQCILTKYLFVAVVCITIYPDKMERLYFSWKNIYLQNKTKDWLLC